MFHYPQINHKYCINFVANHPCIMFSCGLSLKAAYKSNVSNFIYCLLALRRFYCWFWFSVILMKLYKIAENPIDALLYLANSLLRGDIIAALTKIVEVVQKQETGLLLEVLLIILHRFLTIMQPMFYMIFPSTKDQGSVVNNFRTRVQTMARLMSMIMNWVEYVVLIVTLYSWFWSLYLIHLSCINAKKFYWWGSYLKFWLNDFPHEKIT